MSKIIQKIRLNYKIQVALHLFYKTIDNKIIGNDYSVCAIYLLLS